MKLGLMAPQGWKGEYERWEPSRAWARTVELASDAETLGFESLWVFDHFQTVPEPREQITFESFSALAALAAVTSRIRLGQMVACAGFRNAALTAKIASTIDVISGGRFELGLGAGWKEDEWRAYGYGFPPIAKRLETLADTLVIVRRMLEPGRARHEGRHLRVIDAINEPKGLQWPRVPIIVGGNGENVTWRLAARYADELNLVYVGPDDLAAAKPLIARRCEEERRDPASLRVSVYAPDELMRQAGQARVDSLGEYAALGIARLVAFLPRSTIDPEAQARLAADARAAGIPLDPPARDSSATPGLMPVGSARR